VVVEVVAVDVVEVVVVSASDCEAGVSELISVVGTLGMVLPSASRVVSGTGVN
jgi:hypothetical protein